MITIVMVILAMITIVMVILAMITIVMLILAIIRIVMVILPMITIVMVILAMITIVMVILATCRHPTLLLDRAEGVGEPGGGSGDILAFLPYLRMSSCFFCSLPRSSGICALREEMMRACTCGRGSNHLGAIPGQDCTLASLALLIRSFSFLRVEFLVRPCRSENRSASSALGDL